MQGAESFWTFCSELLYPSRCALCQRLMDSHLCTECVAEMGRYSGAHRPIDGTDGTFSLFHYDGRAAQAVRRLKYSRSTALASPMSAMLLEEYQALGWRCDAVLPVPIHFSRECVRGFNQARLLAEGFEVPVEERVLRRIRRTRPQVQLSPQQRSTNLIDAFQASSSVQGKAVLLLDDVLTTGATVRECAKALRVAGVGAIYILTFARG